MHISSTLLLLATITMAAHGVEQAHVVAIKQGVVQLNDKIDIADEEVVIPEQLDIIGPHRITILSKTFTPPKERKFKSFGTTFVDVLADPTLVVTAKPKDAATEIKIMGTFFNVTAVKFPLKCEGNIEVPKGGSGPGVIPELHWSAKMGAIVVVLTFDDGPHIAKITEGNRTDKVLNTLRKNSVQQETKAAFFVQTHVPFRGGSAFGQQLMKRENDEGHIVEVHTGSTEDHTAHTDRVKLPPYDVTNDGVPDGETALDSDLIRAKARILATTGHAAKYVRAPYGRTNAAVKKAYAREGLRHILWDIDSLDSRAISTVADVNASLQAGLRQAITKNKTEAVVLFHDIRELTATNLEGYMKTLSDTAHTEGIEIVFTKNQEQIEAIFYNRND